MLDGITLPAAVLASSPWVLLALTFLLIVTGRLVPRTTHQDVIDDRNAWREAHRVSEQARIEDLRQSDQMMDALNAVRAVVEALPQGPPPARRRPGR